MKCDCNRTTEINESLKYLLIFLKEGMILLNQFTLTVRNAAILSNESARLAPIHP